jgi:hypothetical protein
MSRNDLSNARWHKSSYSDGQANCVEVAAAGRVAVRDSKSPDETTLTLTPDAWRLFIERLTAGH